MSIWRRYDPNDLDNLEPVYADRMLRAFNWLGRKYFRAEVRGLARVPSGAGLYVGNHSGGSISPDTVLFWGACYREHGFAGLPYGLGHDVSTTLPLAHQLVAPLRVIRASHDNAARVFARGMKALVYPGGGEEATRPWRARHQIRFGGRVGYVRLALRHGVPIYPVVAEGGHDALFILHDFRGLARALRLHRWLRLEVFPVALALPWGLTSGAMPYLPLPVRIQIEVLPAIRFARSGPEAAADEAYVRACADEVEGRMQAALRRMATHPPAL